MTTTYPIRYRRNVVSQYVSTGFQAGLALITTPLLARSLGKEGYGIWVLVASFALYLEVLEFGLGKATPKFVAEADARQDEAEMRSVVATSFWILAGLGAAAAVIGVVVAAAFPSLFDVPPELVEPARVLVILVLADLALSIPMDTFGGVLMGLQRFYIVNATLVAVAATQAAAWAIVLAAGGGLEELAIVTVGISLTGQLSRYVLARRYAPSLRIAPRLVDRALARRFTRVSGWFFVLDISKLLLVRLDVVVVGIVVGVPAAGVYAVGQRLTLALEQLVEPLTKAFFPHASALSATDDREGLRRTLLAGTRLSLAVAAPLGLAMAFVAEPLLRLWLGRGFGDAAQVVVFLAAAVLVQAVTRTGFLMLQGTDQVRRPALFSFAEAVLNLSLSLVLAHTMGLEGVALATLIATTLVNVVFLPYMCRQFGLSVGALLGPLARAHLPALVAAGAAGAAVLALDPTGVAAVACALAVAGAYAGVFVLFGLRPGDRA